MDDADKAQQAHIDGIMARLEPDLKAGPDSVAISTAISLKRIADALDKAIAMADDDHE